MSQKRHIHSGYLVIAIVVSLVSQGVAVGTWALLRQESTPILVIAKRGDGTGVVSASVGDRSFSCGTHCIEYMEKEETLRLEAKADEGSVFAGWSEECQVGDWATECIALVNKRPVKVIARFIKLSEDVSMEHVGDPLKEEKTPELSLPEIEDIDELLETKPAPKKEEKKKLAVSIPVEPKPDSRQKLKAVELPDQNEVEAAPDDARYESDKNRDVKEETRVLDTNLEKQLDGEQRFSEQSEVEADDIGAKETEIARAKDVQDPSLSDPTESTTARGQQEALAMKSGLSGRDGEDGDFQSQRKPGVFDMRGIGGQGRLGEGKSGKPGSPGLPGINRAMTAQEYDKFFGKEFAKNEQAEGRKRASRKKGRWARKQKAIKAALENFNTEVKVGNQAALKTRRAPFAVYKTRMHRRIHELWGFGFLEELDRKGASHPLNDFKLVTKTEIVINPDGTIDKVNIARTSGLLEFDVAALDTVLSAGPFPKTPPEIRSPDGKVYVHWQFNRNHRQCGTFNAQGFILLKPPAPSKSVDLASSIANRRKTVADALKENAGDSSGTFASPDDAGAQFAANLWITGFNKRNVSKMLKVTSTPFRTGGGMETGSKAAVATIYKTIVAETKGRFLDWQLLTGAQFRKRFGALPQGAIGSRQHLYLTVLVKSSVFVVELKNNKGTYTAMGFFRN